MIGTADAAGCCLSLFKVTEGCGRASGKGLSRGKACVIVLVKMFNPSVRDLRRQEIHSVTSFRRVLLHWTLGLNNKISDI